MRGADAAILASRTASALGATMFSIPAAATLEAGARWYFRDQGTRCPPVSTTLTSIHSAGLIMAMSPVAALSDPLSQVYWDLVYTRRPSWENLASSMPWQSSRTASRGTPSLRIASVEITWPSATVTNSTPCRSVVGRTQSIGASCPPSTVSQHPNHGSQRASTS